MYENTIRGNRRSGKTTALVRIVASEAETPHRNILIYGHSVSMEALQDRVEQAVGDKMFLKTRFPRMSIELQNGTRIVFVAEGEKVRGFLPDVIAVDNAEYVKFDSEYWDAIYRLCAPETRIWMTETEPDA